MKLRGYFSKDLDEIFNRINLQKILKGGDTQANISNK